MTTSVFYLVYGPPGSGKTTFAKTLKGKLFEVDDFEGLYKDGVMSLELLSDAHVWCKSAFKEAIDAGESCIIHTIIRMDSPNTKYYIDLANQHGYDVIRCTPAHGLLFYENSLSTKEQIELLVTRRGKGTSKYVPENIIRECCENF